MDGAWTLPDYWVKLAAERLKREGTFQRVFYDGRVRTADDFLATMKSSIPVWVFRNDEPAGLGWINGIADDRAFIHFAAFKSSWGATLSGGKLVVDYFFSMRGQDGHPLLNLLLGVTPNSNRLACRFIQKVGFTPVGIIPALLPNAYTSERDDALISYCQREHHG